ncbi:hypothetical protein [Nitrosomonas sp. H1_AOB3]|uniref:hypothetical protein n=1 Tax=Nitrosomonas sp. H1_AOB3 TaxID=2741553 RepID=UPI001935E067|nr:hypothetical protein [Nitrosomonas sp. H1_AOB3]QOJ08463.1 MAG: hypothetical protein HRU73_02560 [Nitrosomonas sp. H1_AOB3]
MKARLDTMMRNFKMKPLEEVISYLEHLGVAVAFMAGSVAIMKFRALLVPEYPFVAGFIGFGLFISSFVVLVWVAMSGWHKILEHRGYTRSNHVLGFILVFVSSLFVVAGIYATLSS